MGLADIRPESRGRIANILDELYGRELRADLLVRIGDLLDSHDRKAAPPPKTTGPLTEEDVFLITYPDMVQAANQPPLAVLNRFLEDHLTGIVSGVHLLPFFPSSSDDGFSIIDYRSVDPDYGTWTHIEWLSSRFRLMADAVINHVSRESEWFQRFLRGQPPYTDYFVTVPHDTDLADVVRPRDRPLLTPFSTASGEQHVWTTFSPDQVDLNYRSPDVLLEILSLLLAYLRHGVQVFRLDAVAFLWKEPGTPSIHLRETHLIIQLMRAVMEAVAPWAILITETNVPHEENISYFGDGSNEAHLVYQFPLPPLVLYTFHTGDADPLNRWIRGLRLPSLHVSTLNFLASHDGVGLRPTQDILTKGAADELVRLARASGGGITYRQIGPEGKQPYELNVTYLDALAKPGELERDPSSAIKRFLCAHSLLLSLQGIPAIYFHSLFGSRNDTEDLVESGRLRSINRQKLDLETLVRELEDPHSLRNQVFEGMSTMLRRRPGLSAFHPRSRQEVLLLPAGLIGIRRLPYDGSPPVTLLHNATGRQLEANLPSSPRTGWVDLLRGQPVPSGPIPLQPWGYYWLQESPPEIPGE